VGSVYVRGQAPVVVIVSIQLVSPASGESRTLVLTFRLRSLGFHSISFPSEWGVGKFAFTTASWEVVSIQLVSPASGELNNVFLSCKEDEMFPFN